MSGNRRNKRRHKIGFGYIGSGNTHDVFFRKPKVVFSEIKDKLNLQSQEKFHKDFNDKKLTNIEGNRIKDRIRETEKQRMKKIVFIFIITFLIIFILVRYLISYLFS